MQLTINFSRRGLALAGVGLIATVALVACDSGQDKENDQQDQATNQLVSGQPLPQFKYSQARQNLIELETAQAQGVQTTTFLYNEGVQDPISSCPSVGVPMPNTASLSNPLRKTPYHDVAVGQMDPTGVYVPEASNGTYVICLDASGTPYAQYWEGNVQTVFGPAVWNKETHSVELTGPSSFNFSKQKGK